MPHNQVRLMRILFLTDNFPPEVNAPATRTYEHCVEWVKKGHEVTIITCVPNFPKGKVFEGYKNNLRQEEIIDGIRVIRVWSYIAANKGFFKRIVDFVSYAIMAFFAGLFIKTDVIIGTSPQFFTAVSARMLSLFKRKRWIMEVRDLWPESIAAVGAMKKESGVYKVLERVEHHLYKSAKLVIPVTDAFKVYIDGIVENPSKVKVFKNGVNLSKFEPCSKDEKLMDELNLEGKFVVGYLGTHGMAHALDFILDCAKEIEDSSIQIILQGGGAEKERLVQRAKDENITNILFLPFVSKQEIKRYISILDVALVNLKKSDTFKSVIPSKIFENASMQKPILHGVEGESKDIIVKYNAGVPFEPENKIAFLEGLKDIRNNYNEYLKGCQDLAIDFDRTKIADNMLHVIQTIQK